MSQRTIWTIALLLLGALIGGVYWWQLPAPAPKAPVLAAAPAAAPAPAPAASESPVIRFPIDADASQGASAPSDKSAAAPAGIPEILVEALGRKAVLEFVNVDAFAYRVVATVDNLARSHAPARLWPVHPAGGRFGTQPVNEGEASAVITAENAKRYAAFVAWVETLDVKTVSALYRRLYPNFQRAYEELGYPGRYFNDRVIDVVDHLLATPTLDEPVAVKLADIKGPIQPPRPWVMIEFADPSIEARSAGQKLLMRMGNDNAQRIKAKLRELRAALTQRR
jgi:hypothetical protein